MKNLMGLKAVCLAVGIISMGFASPSQAGSCRPVLWQEVKKLADECKTQIKAGEKCEAIQFFEDHSASFRIQGHEYRAQLVDSPFTDGGDLNDLLIRRDDGCQLERRSVPAFGDLLNGLAF